MLPRAYRLIRWSITVTILLVATLAAIILWDYYTASPWTRNGQVRAQVVNMAPRISGQIIAVPVHDNQYVHKGDVLYEVDPFDFRVRLDVARARAAERKADLAFRLSQSKRRANVPGVAVSGEEKQQYAAQAAQAQAQYDAALADVRQAQINLDRTKIRSSIDGYVTNLMMRPGDYADAGRQNIQIIDARSFWVDGYFEETKLHAVHVGDPVRIDLIGYRQPLFGHVASVTRGIASTNAAVSTQGLPTVDPVYTWVRLAQRIPVRIQIDSVPKSITLAAGTTATVTIVNEAGKRQHMSAKDALGHVGDDIRHLTGH